MRPLVFSTDLSLDRAAAWLSDAGFAVAAADLAADPREERTVIMMPAARAAWFATSEEGRARLQHEGRVLRLVAERCSFEAPRVLFESEDGALQVRALVPGKTDPFDAYRQAQGSAAKARAFGASLGAIFAEQHTHIRERDGAGWLRRALPWPLPQGSTRAERNYAASK